MVAYYVQQSMSGLKVDECQAAAQRCNRRGVTSRIVRAKCNQNYATKKRSLWGKCKTSMNAFMQKKIAQLAMQLSTNSPRSGFKACESAG